MFYRKCGLEIPDDSFFCPKCGEQTSPSIDQHQAPDTQQKQSASLPIENKTPPPNPKQEILQVTKSPYTIKERILFLFKFSGRISRKTFIKYSLAITAIQISLGCILGESRDVSFGMFLFICLLFSLIPELSLGVRRMRDAGIPLIFIPICFFIMMYFSSQANYYTEEASIRYKYAKHVWFTDQALQREASSYTNTALLYQAGTMGVSLLSWGILASVPSRKKKE